MNKFFVLLFLLFCVSCQRMCKEEMLMYQIIGQHDKLQKKKYHFHLIGSGGGIPDDVTLFTLHYVSRDRVDILEARKMFVNNVEALLQLINTNEQIRPYLCNYPFTVKNLEFSIAFEDEFIHMREPPFLAYVSLINKKIFYSYYDQNSGRFIGKDYNEPYSEARRIVLGDEPFTNCFE